MYHSVDARNGNAGSFGLSVSPDNFADQVAALAAERTIIPLEELARCLRAGRLPRGAVAVTFDDGYANNHAIAGPILDHFNAPATLFLMTEAVDTAAFWWDCLERVIMTAPDLPGTLRVPLEDQTLEVAVEGANRRDVFCTVWSRLRGLGPRARDRAIAQLGAMLDVLPTDPSLRPVTTPEVEQLEGSILSVGAHTLTHPSLPTLASVDLVREIAGSKAVCEGLLGGRIATFAYPFGEYNRTARAVVAAAGFSVACTTVHRAVRSDDDCLALPRVYVRDWTGDELMEELRRLDVD
jgi:peptidoglycan/xylan/chitin deacetylase (PgdA/CDA1 family)